MKLSNFLKTLSPFLVAIVTGLAFVSCSSDKDEPEHSDNSGYGTESMIPYSVLPGSWLIESIKDTESGATTTINQKVTFSSFVPMQENDIVSGVGKELWAHGYNEILSYDGLEEGDYKSVIIGFCKDKGESLTKSLIYTFSFSVGVYENEEYESQSFALSDLHYTSNILTAKASSYAYVKAGVIKQVNGTITMKKL